MNEQTIFSETLEREPAERSAFLEEVCGDDAELRKRVENLLQLHEQAGDFLESPPPELGSSPTAVLDISEKPGTQIGPYKLLQQIGEGGMGVVYMAEQTEPVSRRVALKIIKPGMDTRQVIARFEAERQALATMDHPNVSKVFDAGMTDTGRPYFVMELIKGVPITEYCDEHQLSPRERLELFLPACHAVQHAHQKGIIHRDIKPSNVMVVHYDDRPVPKIIDFGVAKAIEQRLTEKTLFTEFGQVVGTMEYMSPEQARLNQQDIDTRSDIYSLGVLLYELLAGETPFDGKRLRSAAFDELLRIIREEEPPRPSQRLSTSQSLPSIAANRHLDPKQLSTLVHGELDWIVMKALEKDRTRRYDTASKFAEDVQHYLNDEEVAACPPSAAYKFRKLARRYKATIATTLAIAAALIVGTSLATWQAIQASRERDRAMAAEMTAETEAKSAQHEAERAIAAEDIATAEAENAEQQRRQARREQYSAEIVAGQTELASDNLGGLYNRLINYLPMDGEEDLRDWEWYYLMSRCRQEERTVVHRGRSPYAAWSPDGQLIGVPAAIWRADTGEQIRQFNTSYIARVRVAWSPDASKFAWCMTEDENAFYVWDRPTDQVTRFTGHKHSVKGVSWSPNGAQIASSSHDKTIKVWDAATGAVLWTSPDLGTAANSLDWSPDGKLLALEISRQGVKVWDTTQWELVHEVPSEVISSHCVKWHPEGNLLAVSNSESWYVLDRSDWSIKQRQSLVRGGQAIAYSPDGSRIAVTDGEAIEVWEADGETKLTELNGHLAPVISISWAPDGHRLVTADNVKDIKLWDLDHFVDKPTIAIGDPLQSLVWLDDQRTLVTVSQEDGSSSWWDAEKGSLQNTEEPMVSMPFQLSPDRRLAAVREQDQPTLTILDAASGNKQAALQLTPERTLQSFAFSPDSNRVVLQSFAKQRSYLDFWKIDEPQPAGTWDWHRPYLNGWTDHRLFTWEPQGNRLASIGTGDQGDNGSTFELDHLHVFDADTGERILKWTPAGRGKTTCLAWSQDGRYLAMGTNEGRLEVVDLKTQSQRFSKKLHRHGITSLAWHPRGNRLACGTEDRSVKIISGIDAGLLLTIPVPDDPPVQLAWNEEGRSLAAATNTGHIHTWSTRKAYEITPEGQRRSELAWAYYDRARRASGKEKQAALRAFFQYAPDTLAFWEARGGALALLGKFEEATQEYSKKVESNIQYAFWAAYSRAYALLAAGKMDDYRNACAQLVERFQDSPVPSNHQHIAWLCVLTPSQEVDWHHRLDLEGAGLREQGDKGEHREVLCRSAIWFREGKYEDAFNVASNLVTRLKRGGGIVERYYLACSQYFLAMTLQKINEPLQAAAMFAEANDHALYVKGMNASWHYDVVLDTLRSEAEAMINQPLEKKSEQEETQPKEEA